ncbi:MAG: UDP-N-acetylmuramoyl-L-alanyl-D-glutamate--2,6-diaminopimelate ligase [Candidatus Binatia bacterium]|nr:UDP-N-acetylmuramoyl-L-alanyl-D-glutamate--2,6-diaminopimelate ligase [Candidatus Binatia bacterium]
MSHSLQSLLKGTPHELLQGRWDVQVSSIVADSREVEPGSLFVCLTGYRTEGGETRADRHDFIPEAVARGAAALVVERPVTVSEGVTVVRVPDVWLAHAQIASRFYRQPSRDLVVVGVTGTSGKTSTVYFVDAVLRNAGWPTARFGTVEHRIGGEVYPARQTTPEAHELQALLRRAVDAGCRAVVMEVSSHALELRRVAEVAFDVGVFTNLGRDHLNFHPDMHHYRRAKGRLFEELASGGKDGIAVINIDDAAAPYMIEVNRGRLLTYGQGDRADVRVVETRISPTDTWFSAMTPLGPCEVRLPVPGAFQVANAVAALAVGIALGLPRDTVVAGLAAVPQVPGRFEVVNPGGEFLVIVDYAHKPDALERLLTGARSLARGRIITVFGCGGNRDRGKRPLMGEVAARLSDVVVVTSDNPRDEDPEAIISEIVAGVPREYASKLRVDVDRRRAITSAIREAKPGDLVMIAGKGHETYQIFGGQKLPFDDCAVAREALRARGALQGAWRARSSSAQGAREDER